ncbi:kinesin-like protein KIN-6 isoform X2 [Typha angustifolia]|uniref:kinesin-like protein KIN-6 isoform X2 n=1 Tax=Typha angustifolia TaxID=59011 RepID=UPI003C2CAD96
MDSTTPPLPTTVRRNPHRRAKQIPSATPFPLDDLIHPDPPQIPLPSSSNSDTSQNLNVFLRIRPLDVAPRPTRNPPGPKSRLPQRKGKGASPKKVKKTNDVCLVVNDSSSVTLSAPPSSSLDGKRSKSETYDGFSYVFSPESPQQEIFERVMNPLLIDFMGGKSALLVAMGPTGSGKTHTMFGCPREPGLVPLALQMIFGNASLSSDSDLQRLYYMSMFEIYSERGKGERIIDLLSDAADLSLQQTTIKGLQETMILNIAEAESLVACGMLKRTTAATNANSQSSRSQCIINIRSAQKDIDDGNDICSGSVLTIADLAGAEREKRTGIQGARIMESNFINNTSMVLGLCLRSLLEHQKNPKKPLEKHFKNSLLTRYLRDYLEGRKRMTLILTVKPGEHDYLDTSFLLRQASPYMKIKFTNAEGSSSMPSQKRSNASLICQENKKRRKIDDLESSFVCSFKDFDANVGGKSDLDANDEHQSSHKESTETMSISMGLHNDLYAELQRVTRNEELMRNFARAIWVVLKQYKQKLSESENAAESLKEAIRKKDCQILELEKELRKINSCSSCQNHSYVEEFSSGLDGLSFCLATGPLLYPSNQDKLKSTDAAHNDFVLQGSTPVNKDTQELICFGPKITLAGLNIKGSPTEDLSSTVRSLILEKSGFIPENVKPGASNTTCSSASSGGSEKQTSERHESFSEMGHGNNGTEEQTESGVREMLSLVDPKESAHTDSIVNFKQECALMGGVTGSHTSSELHSMPHKEKNLDQKPKSCEVLKQENKDYEGVKSPQSDSLCKENSTEVLLSSVSNPQSLDIGDNGRDISPLLENEKASFVEDIKPSRLYVLPIEDTKPTEKCLVRPPERENHGSASIPCNINKPKRRLLPASKMLLKEFIGPDMDSDKPKDVRVKASAEKIGRSQGSMSLLRLLKANPIQGI